jgi:hypothetical protein
MLLPFPLGASMACYRVSFTYNSRVPICLVCDKKRKCLCGDSSASEICNRARQSVCYICDNIKRIFAKRCAGNLPQTPGTEALSSVLVSHGSYVQIVLKVNFLKTTSRLKKDLHK